MVDAGSNPVAPTIFTKKTETNETKLQEKKPNLFGKKRRDSL